MCGIVGAWRLDGGPVEAAPLERMLGAIAHRGPDDNGIWTGSQVGLGHCRLSIIDLSPAGHQPMLTTDGQGVLAYNGEVYNYRELRAELERDGFRFTGNSDTEVVLAALHAWGPEKSIPRFNGMFAFAYFDARDNTLWLGRDRLGIKHLYTTETDGMLLFGSEVKAILAYPGYRMAIDDAALRNRFLTKPRAHETLFQGVAGLLPGSLWKVTTAGIRKARYFEVESSIDADRVREAHRHGDRTAMIDAFREALSDSVRMHLASDAPLAAMCSGGVDSSLVAALAHDEVPGLTGYVADVPPGGGEGAQAELAGRHIGVAMRRVEIGREDYMRLWSDAVFHLDSPTFFPSAPALLAVAWACRRDGIKVLLTGEGADELFGGYIWHAEAHRNWQRRLWVERWVPGLISPRARRRAREFPLDPPLTQRGWERSVRQAMAQRTDDQTMPARLMSALSGAGDEADIAFLVSGYNDLIEHLSWLLHRHDHMGMAASMEMRVPFLENRLIDMGLHLPRWAKFHDKQGKWLEKQVALERLPSEVVMAKKKGFPMPRSYTAGTERLLVGGMLADRLGWSTASTRAIIETFPTHAHLRYLTVSAEIFLRQQVGGLSAGEVGEQLNAVTRAL